MRKVLYILFIFIGISGLAQQDYLNSQYMFNLYNINPAYAGSKDALATSLSHRSQWTGFDGAPMTQTLSIHAPIKKFNLGVGGQLFRDVIGPREITGINTTYAYHLKLGKGKLGFGLKVGLINYTYNWDELNYKDVTDIVIGQGKTNGLKLDFAFGSYYQDRNQFAGFELGHIASPDITTASVAMDYKPHLSLFYGYAFELSEDIVLKPSLLVRATQASQISDINLSVLFKKKIWTGVSYRTSGAIIFMADYFVTPKLRLGYSYDFTINGLSNYQTGSHEIFVGYDFQIFKTDMLSPRYF